jgi:LuxR family maltose regulon positive regulatory protein
MPRGVLHLLCWSQQEQRYIIMISERILSSEITTSPGAWTRWLDGVASFAFESRSGVHCTIRKERLRRGDAYWYAYRSIQGRTKKRYLGKTADLSFELLEEISTRFTTEEREMAPSAPAPKAHQTATNRGRAPSVSSPLLETKLHPPQFPALLIERTRLLVRLDISFAHKLTLLLAPAGFGKTTLVNQWLTTRSTSPTFPAAAWVSLDSADNDLLRFWRYIMTACQTLLGQERRASGQAVLALFTAAIHSPFEQPPMEMALTSLLNDLAWPSSGGLLVLDDYHAITEPRIHETLAFFIDHLPKAVHVLLLSRAEPPLPLLRWHVRGELCELHGTDLRFSLEETADFLHQTLPFSLSETVLTRLDASLEGWAAGLRLLSLTLSRWRTSHVVELALLSLGEHAGLSSPHRSLLDYLVSEIFETQPEPIQRFLLQTSVLSRLCGPLCDAVTRSENSATQLEGVERGGLFLEALEGPGGWYRYHALFAEAMRREASSRLGEEALRALSLRASSWYEQEALFTEAIEAAWQAQDLERVARLIEQRDAQGGFSEPQTMRHWLEQLPEAVLREHPMLCLLFATELRFPVELRFAQAAMSVPQVVPLTSEENRRIETLLQMAEESWRRCGMQPWIGIIWAFRMMSSLMDKEPFSSLVDSAQQALVFLPQEAQDRRVQMWRGACLLFVGIEKLRMGQVGEARQLLLQAQEHNRNRFLTTMSSLMLGRSHLLQGELKLARRYHRQVLSDARELGDDEMAADALLELAWLAFEANDLNGAEQQAREAREVTQRVHSHRQELSDRATLQFALITHAQGETAAALQQLTTLLVAPQTEWTLSGFWLSSRIRNWQGRLRIATGDLQAVEDSLPGQSQSSESISFTEHLEEQILRVRLLLAQGNAETARQQLADLLPMAKAQLHQYHALEIELLLALTYAASEQEQQAHSWLRQTLSQTVHERFIRLFLNEGKPMILLLRSLRKHLQHDTILRSYVQMILLAAQRAESPHALISTSDGPPFEPLSLQEKRVLRLLATGWTNQEIAHELIVSVNTVKYHVKHLYQKLGVSNRQQASMAARDLSLGEPL